MEIRFDGAVVHTLDRDDWREARLWCRINNYDLSRGMTEIIPAGGSPAPVDNRALAARLMDHVRGELSRYPIVAGTAGVGRPSRDEMAPRLAAAAVAPFPGQVRLGGPGEPWIVAL